MDTDRMEKKTWKAEKDLAKHGHTGSGRRRNDVGGSRGECGGQSGMGELCRPMRCKRVEGLRSKVHCNGSILSCHLYEIALLFECC